MDVHVPFLPLFPTGLVGPVRPVVRSYKSFHRLEDPSSPRRRKPPKTEKFDRFLCEHDTELSRGCRNDRGHMEAGPKHVCTEEDATKSQEANGSLGSCGVVLAHGAQLESCINEGRLYLLRAELVVAETGQGDRVSEVLLEGHRVLEDDKGGNDEEDIFENTRHGEDDRRSLADLWSSASVKRKSRAAQSARDIQGTQRQHSA